MSFRCAWTLAADGHAADGRQDPGELLLHDRPRVTSPLMQHGVTAQANARPEAWALAFKGTRMTYGALEET